MRMERYGVDPYMSTTVRSSSDCRPRSNGRLKATVSHAELATRAETADVFIALCAITEAHDDVNADVRHVDFRSCQT